MTSKADGPGPVTSRWRAAGWLLVFAAGYAGIVVGSGRLEEVPEASPQAWIVYETQEETVRLEESDGRWWVVEPYHAEMDREVLTWLRQAVLDLEETWEPLEGAVHDLEVYGLGEGATAFRAGRGREVLHEWWVGDPLVTGKGSYASSVRGEVGTTVAHLSSLLDLPVQELRDHHAFQARPEVVRRITLQGPQGTLTVSGKGWDWWIDGWGRAAPSKVDALVMGLLDLRVEGWDGPASLPDEEMYRVEIEEEGGRVHVVSTGALVGPEVPVWVAPGTLGWMGAERLALFKQSPRSLGVRKVLEVPEPQRVRVRRGEEVWVYDRMDGGWFNGATRSHRDDAVVDEWLSLEVDGHKEPLMMEAGPCRVEVSGERAEVVVTLSWSRKNATLYATDGAGGMALPLLPLEPSSHPMTLCAIP